MLGVQRSPGVISVERPVMVTMPEMSVAPRQLKATQLCSFHQICTSCLGPALEQFAIRRQRGSSWSSHAFLYMKLQTSWSKKDKCWWWGQFLGNKKFLPIPESRCQSSGKHRTYMCWGCPWCTSITWGEQWDPGVWSVILFLIVSCLEINSK